MLKSIKNLFVSIRNHFKMGWYISMLQECGDVVPFEDVPKILEGILQETMIENESYSDKPITLGGEKSAIYIVGDDPKEARIIYSIPSMLKWYKISPKERITIPYLMGCVAYSYAHERTHMQQGLTRNEINNNRDIVYEKRWYEEEAITSGVEQVGVLARLFADNIIDYQSALSLLRRIRQNGTTITV